MIERMTGQVGDSCHLVLQATLLFN